MTSHTLDVRVERTRELVHAAVRHIIETEGHHAVTPQRVSNDTGVSRSTLHRHWPDVRTLVLEALADPEPAADTPLLGDLRLDLGVDLHQLRLALNDPRKRAVLLSMLSESAFDADFAHALHTHTASHMDRLARVIEAGQRDGILRRDIAVDVAASMLAGPLFVRRMLFGIDIDPAFVDTVVDSFIAANAAPSPR